MSNEIDFKMKATSKALIILGITFSLISTIRYYIIYPDLDRFFAYAIMGFLIMFVRWAHSRIDKLNQTNLAQWKFMDNIFYSRGRD